MVILSILICHYKENEFQVKRLLESIKFNSKYSDSLEILLYNDGNENIISDNLFSQYSIPLTYKICERQGTSRLRNKMIKECHGQFIWFIDSDDYLLENAIDQIIEKLSQNLSLDLLQVGCVQERCSYKNFYFPSFSDYSIVCCNVLRKQFLIDNNLLCDESAYLAGDIVIETLPKWYTKNHDKLLIAAFTYTFNPQSVVRARKTNGWAEEQIKVIENIIERLLKENKKYWAYREYFNFIIYYNNKYIHDKYKSLFQNLGFYNLPIRMDLR